MRWLEPWTNKEFEDTVPNSILVDEKRTRRKRMIAVRLIVAIIVVSGCCGCCGLVGCGYQNMMMMNKTRNATNGYGTDLPLIQ